MVKIAQEKKIKKLQDGMANFMRENHEYYRRHYKKGRHFLNALDQRAKSGRAVGVRLWKESFER